MKPDDAAKQLHAAGKRRRLQFGLRTVLLLTLVAASVCAWLTRPEWIEERYANGSVFVSYQVIRDAKQAPARRGRWQIADENGVPRVKGRFSGDVPYGRWTWHDGGGAKLLEGECPGGTREGDWIEWHSDGSRKSESYYVDGILDGEFKEWWPGKHLRTQGRYERGEQTGRWTSWDEQGRKRREGNYVASRKEGPWRAWDSAGRPLAVQIYSSGKLVPAGNRKHLDHWARLLENGRPVERGEAAWALGQVGWPATPVLVHGLSSTDAATRAWSATGLGSMAAPENKGIAALIAALDDQDVLVRCAAAAALGHIGPPAVEAKAGLQRLAGEKANGARDLALAAIAAVDLHDWQALRELLKHRPLNPADASSDFDSDVIAPLVPGDAGYLAALPDEKFYARHAWLVPALTKALREDEATALAACRSLGVIGTNASLDALIVALNDERPRLRLAAIDALDRATQFSDRLARVLQRLAENDLDPNVRSKALRFLGKFPGGFRGFAP